LALERTDSAPWSPPSVDEPSSFDGTDLDPADALAGPAVAVVL
jgi:hypothetical protein